VRGCAEFVTPHAAGLASSAVERQVAVSSRRGSSPVNGENGDLALRLADRIPDGLSPGTTLQAAGSIPVSFTDWNLPSPTDYGPFGSLADHGTAEFLLILNHT
jgi:hypothetical protein